MALFVLSINEQVFVLNRCLAHVTDKDDLLNKLEQARVLIQNVVNNNFTAAQIQFLKLSNAMENTLMEHLPQLYEAATTPDGDIAACVDRIDVALEPLVLPLIAGLEAVVAEAVAS